MCSPSRFSCPAGSLRDGAATFQKHLIFSNQTRPKPCASIYRQLNEFNQLDPLHSRPLFTSQHINADGSRKAVEKHWGGTRNGTFLVGKRKIISNNLRPFFR
jgi:hypothetical protein